MARPTVSTETTESQQRRTERKQAERRLRKGEEPWREEAGVQSVVDAVRDITFPIERDTLRRTAGRRFVIVSGKLEVPLEDVLEKLTEDRFENLGEFQTAVMRHWEGIRYLEVPQEQRPPRGGGRPRQAAKGARGTRVQKKANLRRARRGELTTTRARRAAERLMAQPGKRSIRRTKRTTLAKPGRTTRGKKTARRTRTGR